MDAKHLTALVERHQTREFVGANGRKSFFVLARLHWPALAKPSLMKGEKDPDKAKYRATLIIDPRTKIDALVAAAKEAAIEKFGRDGAKKLADTKDENGVSKLAMPFRKQIGKKDADGFGENGVYINASEGIKWPDGSPKDPPKLITASGAVLPSDTAEMYPGAWVIARIGFFAYNNGGKTGVSASLIALQKIADDDKLKTGGGDAAEGFEPITTAMNGAAAPSAADAFGDTF